MTAFETRQPRVTALAAVLRTLDAAGLQQTYDHCLHCGTAIEGEAFFHAAEGGALCADCAGEGAMPFFAELRPPLTELRQIDWQNPAPPRRVGMCSTPSAPAWGFSPPLWPA